MPTKSKPDLDLINSYVDLIRHYMSPSCNFTTDFFETDAKLDLAQLEHPREYDKAYEIWDRLHSKESGERGR